MQTLNQDIKDRTFKPVYLLFGEEAFLKKSYKSRLREALTDGDTMNYNYFEGKGMNVNEIIGLADTMPFFAGVPGGQRFADVGSQSGTPPER